MPVDNICSVSSVILVFIIIVIIILMPGSPFDIYDGMDRKFIISILEIISPLLQTFFEEFESPCNHGFFNRGDLNDPAVAECVDRGLENLVNFVTEYVVNN